jgi:hypothetical protein
MKTKAHFTLLRILFVKILLVIILFTIVSIATFITIGYFAASKPVSYLPDIHDGDLKPYTSDVNEVGLKSSWYKLSANKYGRVTIKTLGGEGIMSDLAYYSAYEGVKDNWGLVNVSVKLSSDSTISIMGDGPLDTHVRILLTVHNNMSRIEVNIKTLYSKNTIVWREALIAAFDVNVSEVYRKNRQVDVQSFDSEYWLQRQGVRFGNGLRSAWQMD